MATILNYQDRVQIFVEAVLDAYKRGRATRRSAANLLLLVIAESRLDTPRELNALARDLMEALSEDPDDYSEQNLLGDSYGSDFMVMQLATGQDNIKSPPP